MQPAVGHTSEQQSRAKTEAATDHGLAQHHGDEKEEGRQGPTHDADLKLGLLPEPPVHRHRLYGVAPFGCAVDRAWRLKSWDRFEIPQPFSRAAIVYGEPMRIPAKMSDAEVAQWVQRLQDTLTELHHKALQEIANKPS